MKKSQCIICKKEFLKIQMHQVESITSSLYNYLKKEKNLTLSSLDFICSNDINLLRKDYIRDLLLKDKGEISKLEEQVLDSLKEHELISLNPNTEFDQTITFGERVSDKVAEFGGSWKFIILFGGIIVVWIIANSVLLSKGIFDPYPFILLNLVLSCLAALQAPVIMMSQNRQQAKDRVQADMDYKVNLKAELEIRHLKAKLDQLSTNQWHRLLEIQELQAESLEEIISELSKIKKS
jgi:uncharacterized membrane protein